ncbi:hypothetical protein [Amycolatopsis panacis]|uniref:hypothetical protein n=1 Tax=Amycolatopsis panacis TaxID=2340917 RepID=UPI00268689DD|nr:hypothetical protein [Amycolatopsis panacis]
MPANPHHLSLEPATHATANPPFRCQLPSAEDRAAVDEAQRSEIAKPEVHDKWITIKGGSTGTARPAWSARRMRRARCR